MTSIQPLAPEVLCTQCDPAQFSFATTAELEDLTQVLGQTRAVEALKFGIGIRRDGYNLFVLGEPGTGKRTVVRQFLDDKAAHEASPPDWCYVNNFQEAHKPRVMQLPAGTGLKLKNDMEQLMADLRAAIPAVFESEEYRKHRQEMEEKLKEQHEQAFEELRKEAESHSITGHKCETSD